MREEFAADLGEFGIGGKVREVDLDAHDSVHARVELAQRLADAIEGDAHFMLEADGLVVWWDRHAHLTRYEDPTASFGIETQRLAEAFRDRAGEMSDCAHDGTLSCERFRCGGPKPDARYPAVASGPFGMRYGGVARAFKLVQYLFAGGWKGRRRLRCSA